MTSDQPLASDQISGERVSPSDVVELIGARRNHWMNQLARHAHEKPDAIALRFRGASTDWATLHARVDEAAGAFHRRGVGFGDRVALLMTNRPAFIEALLAIGRLGAIAVPVNFRFTAQEVAHLVADSDPAAMIVEHSLVHLLSEGRDADRMACLVVGGDVSALGARFEAYADIVAEPGEPSPAVDVPESCPALIMYTSGTTGRPKGAVLSHANLQAQALTLIRAGRFFGDDEVNLCAIPLFHMGALGVVAPMVLIGGTVVIHPTGSFDPGEVLDALEHERVTNLFLVPTQWQAICEEPTAQSRQLRLRMIAWGAAPASDSLLRRMSEVFPGVPTIATFGQTEMSPVTCVLEGADATRKLGSVGRPVSTVAVRVVDDLMCDLGPGEVGEIVYRGPSMMEGYWNDPEATAAAFAGGWFHSGDLVRRDDEGFIYVVDRKKDMLISGGENIYCAEVENVLASHPHIAEVAVIGRPHTRWGETPVAVIVSRGARAPSVDDLALWCENRLAAYKRPKEVVVVPELPRNATGKVLKGELRDRFSRLKPPADSGG